jgi:uncharacterized protein
MEQRRGFREALLASAASPDDPGYTLFDPFVGSWTFDFYTCANGREILEGKGEWHFSWVLDGRVMQDVWELYSNDSTPRLLERGSTVRMYDRSRKNWRIIFFSPMRGFVDLFTASQVGEEIVLQGIGRSGYPSLWIFSDIAKNSFRWRSEETRDHGKTWVPLVVMKLKRQS